MVITLTLPLPFTTCGPHGWHLDEPHITVNNQPLSSSLFDFSLYFFHNAKELVTHGSGPYSYLPKMEHYCETHLWNDVFNFVQIYIGMPLGTCTHSLICISLVHSSSHAHCLLSVACLPLPMVNCSLLYHLLIASSPVTFHLNNQRYLNSALNPLFYDQCCSPNSS